MFLVILDLRTSSADRSAALAQLEGERASVRAMPGCINFRVFASSERDTDLTVLHEWSDEASFLAYLDSQEFARSGHVLQPMLSDPPLSRRFRAELVDTLA